MTIPKKLFHAITTPCCPTHNFQTIEMLACGLALLGEQMQKWLPGITTVTKNHKWDLHTVIPTRKQKINAGEATTL